MMATETTLTKRLRQHSRRSGFAVGITMALAIAICIGGFVTIYVRLQPYISDFVSQDPPSQEERQAAAAEPTERSSRNSDDGEDADAQPTEADNAEDEPTEDAEPTATEEGFNPDIQASSEAQINLRAGPSTSTDIVTVLSVSQPLQKLGEEDSENPAEDGPRWVNVRTEDGLEGWLREIDTEPFEE